MPSLPAPVPAASAMTATRSWQTASVSVATIVAIWMNTVAAHVATNAVKNWMSAYVRNAKNVSAVHMIVSAKTDLRSNYLSRVTGTVALIYHNILVCTADTHIRMLLRFFVFAASTRDLALRCSSAPTDSTGIRLITP